MGVETDIRRIAQAAKIREEENWDFRAYLKSLDMDDDSCLGSDCLRGESEADESAVRDCDENCLDKNKPRPFMLGDLGGGNTRCFRGESDAIDRD